MRFGKHRREDDLRVKKCFPLFPTLVHGERRWLEICYVHQFYSVSHGGFISTSFIDPDGEWFEKYGREQLEDGLSLFT